MATVLHPKGDRITVLRDPPKQKSEGGIDIGNAVVDDHEIGTILEVGPTVLANQARMATVLIDAILHDNDIHPALRPYQPGDRLLYSRFAGTDATVGGQNICILSEGDVIGVLEGEGE